VFILQACHTSAFCNEEKNRRKEGKLRVKFELVVSSLKANFTYYQEKKMVGIEDFNIWQSESFTLLKIDSGMKLA